MKSENGITLQRKWESKFNAVSVKKSLQTRLKTQMQKNAVAKNAVEIKENKNGRRNHYF